MGEEWRDIAGFEGLYRVSSHGRVCSLLGPVPRILSRSRLKNGYEEVVLYRDGSKFPRVIHRLVAAAFIPNPDGLPLVRHLDDCRRQNNVSNLAWGTVGDNSVDAVGNGRHPIASRTHCINGHEYTEDNIYFDRGHRTCKTCKKAQVAAYTQKKKERKSVVNS